MAPIAEEKLEQARAILRELELDLWLVFVRETEGGGDPVLPFLLDCSLTWQSALIVGRGGERIAIVGKYDDGAVRSSGVWTEVVPYVEGVREPLLEALHRLDPERIALDYSADDHTADGLTHGMYRLLVQHLDGTPYAGRLVSAEALIGAMRGRKSPEEVRRIRRAVEIAERIFAEAGEFARPGRTEREVAAFMLEAARRHGARPAWRPQCPIVNTGPESMVGHGIASDLAIEPGHVLHVDFGVEIDGYRSDLQRCWYVPRAGEDEPPEGVRAAFDTIVGAIAAAAATLRPGVPGWEVDRAAREAVVRSGYPEYRHALGHHVGRSVHDGGGVLGPKWERYGSSPDRLVEAGNVLTLEPSVEDADGRGCLGIEEMVLVTEAGVEWLSERQVRLPCLGRAAM